MNNSEYQVSRETVVLYFLDELNSTDRKRVQLAIRTDPELKEYYLRQLNLFARIDLMEDLSDEDTEFMRYLGLSMDERTAAVDVQPTLRHSHSTKSSKTIEDKRRVILAFPAAQLTDGKLKRSAADDKPHSSNSAMESTADSLSWSMSKEGKAIHLLYASSVDRPSVTLHIEFTVKPRNSRQRTTYDAGPIPFDRDSPTKNLWNAVIELDRFGLQAGSGTITELKGIFDE